LRAVKNLLVPLDVCDVVVVVLELVDDALLFELLDEPVDDDDVEEECVPLLEFVEEFVEL